MKIPLTIFALAASCLAQEDRSVVRFANGDQLSGQVKSLSKETLLWESLILKEPAEFDLTHVVDLSMPANLEKRVGAVAGHVATLEMTNGDSIKGQLGGLSDEEIRLNTWYAGEMVFRRVNVKSVQISQDSDYFYQGPNSIDEWTSSRLGNGWTFKGGSLYSSSTGGIAREIDFPDECSIAFDAAWRGAFRPRIVFFSSDITIPNPKNGYEMVFQGNSVHVKKSGSSKWLGHSTNSGDLRENEKAHIEIRISTVSGKILLYVDGAFIDVWEDEDVDKTKLGKGFHIVSQDSSPLRISNIAVTAWDGYTGELPNRRDKFRNRGFRGNFNLEDEQSTRGADQANVDENRMVLRNGDTIEGEVTKISDEQITLKTKFSEVTFPIARLKNLVLKSADMENPKRNKGDVRATLADGSQLVFRLDEVEDKMLVGFSQNFGTEKFAKDAFKKIEFNIYNRDIEERRLQDDWTP
ncbi:MAG: hypothetical protein IZT59_13440 [Verrucomicrobia bacterium]|jgi:hypothetical protein|nr:hypothetical protein [Verrucomicrobiota bacterium]|tara:strand:- start:5084 stop:6481 length:1398 start_codon:yes stop_codon:yes gene_type:complete